MLSSVHSQLVGVYFHTNCLFNQDSSDWPHFGCHIDEIGGRIPRFSSIRSVGRLLFCHSEPF